MKIAIIGRKKDTASYEKYFSGLPSHAITTLSLGELPSCQAVVLPGGGDITPAFFGEHNTASENIDTELDILQLQALDYCIRYHIPVFGICKGMQIINVAFGGTIIQNLPTASRHRYADGDQYHESVIAKGSFLHSLYGERLRINSAHHQGIHVLGRDLTAIQWACFAEDSSGPKDHCIEALTHRCLPVFGLQWHPERLDPQQTSASSAPLLAYFASLL